MGSFLAHLRRNLLSPGFSGANCIGCRQNTQDWSSQQTGDGHTEHLPNDTSVEMASSLQHFLGDSVLCSLRDDSSQTDSTTNP